MSALPAVWVDVATAADAAGVSVWTVYEWCRAGLVVARRLRCGGGAWRIRLDAEGLPADAPDPPVPPRRARRVMR